MPVRIPNAIAFQRSRASMKQKAVAHALGLDSAYVSQLETGMMLPTTTELRILCRLFACNAEDLYAGHWLVALTEEKGATS